MHHIRRCMVAVGIWSEVELNDRLMDKRENVNDFLDSALLNQTTFSIAVMFSQENYTRFKKFIL